MKKFLALLLSGVMITLALSTTALAEETVEARTISFETMISRYFNNKDTTVITSKSGVNITDTFFNINTASYESGDYDSIREFLHTNVETLKCSIETQASNRMDSSKTVRDYETFYIESKGHGGYLTMTVGGTLTYNRNTGEISNAYNPKLISAEYTDFYDWKFQNKNISTRSWISTDKFTAYFSVRMQTIGQYDYAYENFDFGYHECTISSQGGD